MKKCLKCGKIYDDSWEVCINDKTKLELTSIKEYKNFILSTTSSIDGKRISKYLGVVTGISVTGFHMLREFFAGFSDVFGGESGSYQKEYGDAEKTALEKLISKGLSLGANAVVGVKLDFESIGAKGKSMIMVTATGTAVKLEDKNSLRGCDYD